MGMDDRMEAFDLAQREQFTALIEEGMEWEEAMQVVLIETRERYIHILAMSDEAFQCSDHAHHV